MHVIPSGTIQPKNHFAFAIHRSQLVSKDDGLALQTGYNESDGQLKVCFEVLEHWQVGLCTKSGNPGN